MKQGIKLFLAGTSMGIVLAGGIHFASNFTDTVQRTFRDIKITMNGQAVTPTDVTGKAVEPFIIDGTTYLPVRAVSNALGANVDWDDATSTVKLTSKETSQDSDAKYQAYLKNLEKNLKRVLSEEYGEDDEHLRTQTIHGYVRDAWSEDYDFQLKNNLDLVMYYGEETKTIAKDVIKYYAIYEGNGGKGIFVYYINKAGSLIKYGINRDDEKENGVHQLSIKNVIDFCRVDTNFDGDWLYLEDIDGNFIPAPIEY